MRMEAPELQYLQTLEQRVKMTRKERQELQSALVGYQGECSFDQCTLNILQNTERLLDDVNLDYQSSRCQIDKLLVSGDVLYIVDVKNYDGHYQYHDGCWYYDGQVLSHNIFEQITRAQDIVARCLSDRRVQMTVKSVLVFVGSDVELDVIDPPGHIEIMNFAEACSWLTRLHLSTNVSHNMRWKAALSRYFMPAYRLEHDLSVTPQRYVKRGVCCLKCGSFEMEQSR